MRIVKDYNQYVMRNLARGYSRKEMGVSYVKVSHISDDAFQNISVICMVFLVIITCVGCFIFRRNNCKLI
jgi:hypothetical protein